MTLDLSLSIGSEVLYKNKVHTIKAHLSLTSYLLVDSTSGSEVVVQLNSVSPTHEIYDQNNHVETGFMDVPKEIWQEAQKRAKVIRPIASMNTVPVSTAKQAAKELCVSSRTIYELINRYRKSGGLVTSMVPNTSSGGRGRSRLHPITEQIINSTIDEMYLSKQKYPIAAVVHEIARRCARANLKNPSFNTVNERIKKISSVKAKKHRDGYKAVRTLTAIKGESPPVTAPLELIQIDHTPVDLIIVDEKTRRPIGRPYLTAAIDNFSRCITGFCLTLEAPCATSVGLCLVHSVIDKNTYLANLGIEGEWPVWGKPLGIYVDNAKEFHSEALRRGCAQYGINLQYRPVGEPQYGGIIERLIGTLMQYIHTLPGTTFSNIFERGDYNSEGRAVLTLSELEKWLTLVIVGQYHNKIHASLLEPPIEKYKNGLLKSGGPKPVVQNKKGFLIDFLPILKRSIQRHGFMVDHINYYSNSLQPWIAERNKGEKFIIRRDPRDISRIFVLPPNQNEYIEVPYRTLNHPAITLWEHKEGLKHLKEQGAKKVDEAAIFKAIEQMRKIVDKASATTRSARRKKSRSSHLTEENPVVDYQPIKLPSTSNIDVEYTPAKPFDVIEEW